MRTEQLIRDILGDLADQARTPEVTLARITAGLPQRSGRQRRRTLVLVVAAVVVLALAVAVPTFLVNRTAEPVGRVPGNWNLTHRVEVPPGWEIRGQSISADSETTSVGEPVAADRGTKGCFVDVGGPGRPDTTASQADRTPVSVNGRPGFHSSADETGLSGVSWEYQPGAFALVSCGTGRADDVAMAERVRFEPVPVHLPFRLRSLPRGFEGRAVEASVSSSEGTFPGGALFRATDENAEIRTFSVAVLAGRTEIPPAIPGWETDTVAGRPVVLSARDAKLCFNLEGYTACIQASEGEAEDLTKSLWAAGRRELVVDVAKRLVLADDLDDPSTWFPANRAIPR